MTIRTTERGKLVLFNRGKDRTAIKRGRGMAGDGSGDGAGDRVGDSLACLPRVHDVPNLIPSTV